jgi:hypothetical protein
MKSSSKDPEEAFFAKKFKGICNKCGKQGQKGPDCWSKKEGGSSGKKTEGGGGGADKRTCFKCKKPGHIKGNCLEIKKNKDTEDTGMFLGMTLENNSEEQLEGNEYFESLFGPTTFCKSCEKVENKSENLGETIKKSDPTKRRRGTAGKVFQWVDWCEELADDEEDFCAGSIQGEDKREKIDFLPVIPREISVGTTELQGLSTDPEGQEIKIRTKEDLPKECLQSCEASVEDVSSSEIFEEKGKKNASGTAEDGVDNNFWDYFESCDAKKSENNVHMATSDHQGTD